MESAKENVPDEFGVLVGGVGGLLAFGFRHLFAASVVFPQSYFWYAVVNWTFMVLAFILLGLIARRHPPEKVAQKTPWKESLFFLFLFLLLASTAFFYSFHLGLNILNFFRPILLIFIILFAGIIFMQYRHRIGFYYNSILTSFLFVSTFTLFFMLVSPDRTNFSPREVTICF